MYGIGANGAGLALGGVRDLGLGARRQGVRQPYFVLLVIGLLNQISNLRRKPPATLVLMAGMSVLYLRPDLFEDLFIAGSNSGGPSVPRGRFDIVQSMCMLPSAILDGFGKTGTFEIRRLFLSPFVHGDDMHLYYNMASFLLKGVTLELSMGSQEFMALVGFSLIASQVFFLLSSWMLLHLFNAVETMNACTVGFSGVLFALKYVLSRRSPGVTSFLGFQVHTTYVAWLELVLISLLVPNSSFLGHLCGIFAGILYIEVPSVQRSLGLLSGFSLFRPTPSYTYSRGTATAPSGASGRRAGQSTGTVPPRSAPLPKVDGSASTEKAELQKKVLRQPLLPTEDGGATVDMQMETPSAPPSEDASEIKIVGPGELRRRRLQRLGVDNFDI